MLGLEKTPTKLFFALLVAGLMLPSSHFSFAETMSSSNYMVQNDVISQGGGFATSTNFRGDDAIGDLATGTQISDNWKSCAGYECGFRNAFLRFNLSTGLTPPGTPGGNVDLGTLTTASVTTSDGVSVNSIFITTETSASGGALVTVADEFAGLKRASTADLIDSDTETLVPGNEGYGICVFSATAAGDSPTTFDAAPPFNGNCTKTTGHDVGGLETTRQNLLTTEGVVVGAEAEVLVKAAVSGATAAGDDYSDTLIFTFTATF